jgi:hypothetical protein
VGSGDVWPAVLPNFVIPNRHFISKRESVQRALPYRPQLAHAIAVEGPAVRWHRPTVSLRAVRGRGGPRTSEESAGLCSKHKVTPLRSPALAPVGMTVWERCTPHRPPCHCEPFAGAESRERARKLQFPALNTNFLHYARLRSPGRDDSVGRNARHHQKKKGGRNPAAPWQSLNY